MEKTQDKARRITTIRMIMSGLVRSFFSFSWSVCTFVFFAFERHTGDIYVEIHMPKNDSKRYNTIGLKPRWNSSKYDQKRLWKVRALLLGRRLRHGSCVADHNSPYRITGSHQSRCGPITARAGFSWSWAGLYRGEIAMVRAFTLSLLQAARTASVFDSKRQTKKPRTF